MSGKSYYIAPFMGGTDAEPQEEFYVVQGGKAIAQGVGWTGEERQASAERIAAALNKHDQGLAFIDRYEQRALADGGCEFCGAEEYPVDADSKRMAGPDVSTAQEYHCDHAVDCPLLELGKLYE